MSSILTAVNIQATEVSQLKSSPGRKRAMCSNSPYFHSVTVRYVLPRRPLRPCVHNTPLSEPNRLRYNFAPSLGTIAEED
ncbi:hypothetical protein DSO57_1007060 [Entomophthora muscae]|uniref:Uncharacterized protein n=1 Tax=Entomophthora muscae TaxID=34485 RepID=A0ACC2S9I6_9FUNG|nr:hypothetical protein DSO57_1007060 [Entomophthora muscae]